MPVLSAFGGAVPLYGVPPAAGSWISAVQGAQLSRMGLAVPASPANSRRTPSGNRAVHFSASARPGAGGSHFRHAPLLAMGFSAVRGARLSRMGLAVPALRKFPVPPSGNGAARFSASAHPGAGAYSQRSHCRQLAFLLCRHPVFPHGTGTASSPANFRCPGFQRAHRTTHIKRTDPSGVCPFCHIWDQSTMALTASMRSTTASRGTRAQELPSTTARQESPS